MSRLTKWDWCRASAWHHRRSTTRPRAVWPLVRRLRIEPLEDRRLLSITVNTLVDEADGSIVDGDVSLRDAIAVAASGETIDFLVTGTINLTGLGDLVINKNLTIDGPGASLLTIRAFDPSAAVRDGRRVFNVDDGNLATFKDVSISGLTLSGGDVNSAGGAIHNVAENLSIYACTISGNHAVSGGGVRNSAGHLSVTGSTISGNTVLSNGAGIESSGGTLSVAQSTISGNTSPSGGSGGGIFSSSTATIDSSTISGNSANYGGGVNHIGVGILTTITNSTISGNSARRDGGGVGAFYSDVIVRHSTITGNRADSDNNGTGNGGGVYVTSTLSNATIDHTIVAGNLRQVSARDDVFGAIVASSAFNLVGVDTGLTGISNGTNGNQIGTGASPIDPLLSPLADNGGPTMTHQLLTGSPAIEAGDPAAVAGVGNVPLFDQRGAPFARVADRDGDGTSRVDIGAIERQSLESSNFVVDILVDEDDDNYSPGDLSLREAILLAHFNAGAETITFAPALTSGGPVTVLLTRGELAIHDSMTIEGPAASLLTIDASGNDPSGAPGNGSRVFNIDDGSAATMLEIELAGLTVTGGDESADGGGIFNAENLIITNSTISGNHAGLNGGGIANSNGNVVISGSTISNNSATPVSFLLFVQGGGIFNNGGTLTIANSTISGNATAERGGGIASTGGLMVTNSTISGNSCSNSAANGLGGGIFTSGGVVRHCTITGNFAEVDGGGILSTSALTLDHSIVAGNTRREFGIFFPDDLSGPAFAIYSMIGLGQQFLGPLADNGGPTMTHALPFGSPAIDAGDPNFDPADPDGDPMTDDAVPYDQRGAPFTRVFDGNTDGGARIDIGAFESQPKGVQGDYNQNGVVDAADYTVWHNTLG